MEKILRFYFIIRRNISSQVFGKKTKERELESWEVGRLGRTRKANGV